MSETKEKLEGVVASAEFNSKSASGWAKWTVVFVDGNSYNILMPPDSKDPIIAGNKISCFKGAYNSWVVDKEFLGGKSAEVDEPKTPRSSRSSSSSADAPLNRDTYWKVKDEYERIERDPKIEWQAYFKIIQEFYVNALPFLDQKPSTTQELDAYIDDAIAKVDSLFARKNKK